MAGGAIGNNPETATFVLRDSREKASGEKKIVQAQFNPASLQFSMGAAQKTDSRGDIGYSQNEYKKYADHNTVSRTGIRLSMELTFDGTTQEKPDVITAADEFMYLVKNPYMRNVDFYWGRLQYSGIVESVETEFTYFTKEAAPARAKVSFSMNITEDIRMMGNGANG